MYVEGQKIQGNRDYGLAAQASQLKAAAGTQAIKPSSPVDTELARNLHLIMELEQTINLLIPPLRSILIHDPREPRPSGDKATERAPYSCELERLLCERNDQLNACIVLLREVNDAIRL